MHSGHGFAYDTMRRAEVYSRHHPLEAAAAGQDSLSLQHSLASQANLDHQVCILSYKSTMINKTENTFSLQGCTMSNDICRILQHY